MDDGKFVEEISATVLEPLSLEAAKVELTEPLK